MAYTISRNVPNHTYSNTMQIGDFKAEDYAVIGTGIKPSQTTLTNLDSGVSTPEVVTLQFSKIPNIYLNSDIEKVLQAPSKQGLKLYHSVKQTWTYTDSAGTNPSYDKPVSASIVLNIPNDGIVSTTDVMRLMNDLVGTFVWDSASRLARELRGATNPLDDPIST